MTLSMDRLGTEIFTKIYFKIKEDFTGWAYNLWFKIKAIVLVLIIILVFVVTIKLFKSCAYVINLIKNCCKGIAMLRHKGRKILSRYRSDRKKEGNKKILIESPIYMNNFGFQSDTKS
ncbi:U3 protein [Beatrice Hill virus]|uniref:U3 protein n=1 Tax=Beatrice Hill virus TaxID=1819301 RepID=A0A1J0F5M1_9RHAB|nr:U3 protein [Beatrice Hill virus]APC23644.1 U3 protein [Beatrice Hill virus]